eukprot:435948-Hanusia_phi.AAC.1
MGSLYRMIQQNFIEMEQLFLLLDEEVEVPLRSTSMPSPHPPLSRSKKPAPPPKLSPARGRGSSSTTLALRTSRNGRSSGIFLCGSSLERRLGWWEHR